MTEALQHELRAFFAKIKMPSSPTLAAQILELAEDPNSTIEQFAELIQLDPALAARLLSMTNSAACGQRSPVTTIQRAVTLLGLNRVRTISLGFQLVSHLDRLGSCPFDMKGFWQESLLRGCLARAIAEQVVPTRAEEAFLVGLLQDCGILLLVQLLGRPYADFHESNDRSPLASFEAERGQFKYDHVEMIGALAREWRLPSSIVAQLETHHTETRPTAEQGEGALLGAVSYLVGSIPLNASGRTPHGEDVTLAGYAADVLGLNEAALQRGLSRAGEAYAELGRLLQDIVPDNLDVTDLLNQANLHLSRSCEQQHEQGEREQQRLQHALGAYQAQAARDPLTNVLNRGALNDAARKSVTQAAAAGSAMTVIFMDIDHFKQLNDTYGHACGDTVLQSVAETLRRLVTHRGVVGRYGGEEFLVLVSGLDADGARALGEAIVDGVRNLRVPGVSQPVTCSAGALWSQVPQPSEELIVAADNLMYEAKCAGRDRCCFHRQLAPPAGPPNTVTLLDPRPANNPLAVSVQAFERLAHQLNREAGQTVVDGRKQQRKPLVCPCTLTLLNQTTLELTVEAAYVRNISTGGIGLLCQRAVTRGEAAEVTIRVDDRPVHFAAGVVAFCRHIDGAVHEVGLQVFAHGKQPILSHDPIGAIENLDWVAGLINVVNASNSPVGRQRGEFDEPVHSSTPTP